MQAGLPPLYKFRKHSNASDAIKNAYDATGYSSVPYDTEKVWFPNFKNGDLSDKPRSSRPVAVNDDRLLKLTEEGVPAWQPWTGRGTPVRDRWSPAPPWKSMDIWRIDAERCCTNLLTSEFCLARELRFLRHKRFFKVNQMRRRHTVFTRLGHLFRSQFNNLQDRKFDDKQKLKKCIKHVFSSEPQKFYRSAIQNLHDKFKMLFIYLLSRRSAAHLSSGVRLRPQTTKVGSLAATVVLFYDHIFVQTDLLKRC